MRGLPFASRAIGLACHSYHPSAGTRQRRASAALRNPGLSSSVSARALIMRLPTERSLAHDGTSPQVSTRSCRTGAASGSSRGVRSSTTGATLVGARL